MRRPVIFALYALLVVIWSSTWVAIKFGLEETPPLLGAGVRFVLAGVVLLVIAAALRRPLHTDLVLAAILAILPFAVSYALVYWSEQYITSGLAAVLFGVMPVYVALLAAVLLADEPIHARLFAGLAIALGGLALAFGESLDLGEGRALAGAIAAVVAPLAAAAGNVAIKIRGAGLDAIVLNGWGMAAGGVLLLLASAPFEDWGAAHWNAQALGAIAFLALPGSALAFVVLTILLGKVSVVRMSYLPLLLPFGALMLGWLLYDEPLTAQAIAGAALVAAGLVVAQSRRPGPVARR